MESIEITDMSLASDSTEPPAGFLTTPTEVRIQIYNYLLRLPPYARFTSLYGAKRCRVHAAILLTNRQINYEATPYLYSQNTFLAHPTLLASFPRLRPQCAPVSHPAALAKIRRFHLSLRLDCDVPFDAHDTEIAFDGVDELTLRLEQVSFLGVGCANLRRFEGVRGVGKVVICGSTTGFEDYIEWLKGAMLSKPGTQVDGFKPSDQTLANRLSIIYYA